MRHMLPNGEKETYPIAVLVKNNAFNMTLIKKYITNKIDKQEIVIFDLKENDSKKTPVKLIKEYLGTLLPSLDTLGTKYLLVADSAYYKALTGLKKVSGAYGYVHPCVIKGFEHFHVVLGINPKAFYHDPTSEDKLNQGINALNDHMKGTYKEIGLNIVHSANYPETLQDIEDDLNDLHRHSVLSCDVETFSLKHVDAGIGTISFAWDKNNGIAFCCDWKENKHPPVDGWCGHYEKDEAIRALIYNFLITYEGTLIYHNASFDIKILIYTLFMDKEGDTRGLINGLNTMTRSIEDTKIITYLATNSCTGNVLGLKPNTQEFSGDYGIAVNDIRKIPKRGLLEYNLKDCLNTWYLFNKNYPIMIKDNQESVYREIKIPTVKVCLQMELNGMPLDAYKVAEANEYLSDIASSCKARVLNSSYVINYEKKLRRIEHAKANLLLKKKQHPLSHFDYISFNLNSNPQLAGFLYGELGFTATKFTDSGADATGNKVVSELAASCKDVDIKCLLLDLVEYAKVNKLLTSFIPSFQSASIRGNGRSYLYGNFNIGGTLSGRLSCKDP